MNIGEGSHPENVKVYGPGVEKSGLKANEPTYFTVDCSEAGQGQSVHLISVSTLMCYYFLLNLIITAHFYCLIPTLYDLGLVQEECKLHSTKFTALLPDSVRSFKLL